MTVENIKRFKDCMWLSHEELDRREAAKVSNAEYIYEQGSIEFEMNPADFNFELSDPQVHTIGEQRHGAADQIAILNDCLNVNATSYLSATDLGRSIDLSYTQKTLDFRFNKTTQMLEQKVLHISAGGSKTRWEPIEQYEEPAEINEEIITVD